MDGASHEHLLGYAESGPLEKGAMRVMIRTHAYSERDPFRSPQDGRELGGELEDSPVISRYRKSPQIP
jgi:hypothetical protein